MSRMRLKSLAVLSLKGGSILAYQKGTGFKKQNLDSVTEPECKRV